MASSYVAVLFSSLPTMHDIVLNRYVTFSLFTIM